MVGPFAGKRLLLVGEDADLAGVVADALSRLGADVTALESGRAALEALAVRAPDAAVLDLPLGDVRGSEVLAALKRARVPAVAVSGAYRGVRAAEEVRRLGADAFFEKPFSMEALVAAIAQRLGDEATTAVEAAPVPALDEAPSCPGPPPIASADGLAASFPEPPRARPSVEAPPPRRGELSRTSVPRLLVALHVAQATGALAVARGPVKKIVAVERGAPVYAASNVASERFGALCVRRGIVAADRLEAFRKGRPAARTADLLSDAGLLTPARHAELVAGQIRAVIWSMFEWRGGSYDFRLARPPGGRVAVALATGNLVLEGMLRTSTLPRLQDELPPSAHLAPSPEPAFELSALRLRPQEAHLLALADGTKSVADLVALADLTERDALAILQACRVMRVLDEVERALASTRRMGFM